MIRSVGAGFYPARGRGRAPPLRTSCYTSVGRGALTPPLVNRRTPAGHTGPALQGVALSDPGGQRRPPLRNSIGKRCVGADAYIGPTWFFPYPTAGHTGPALQKNAHPTPGGQRRPPLQHSLQGGTHVSRHPHLPCDKRTHCPARNPSTSLRLVPLPLGKGGFFVGATLAVARGRGRAPPLRTAKYASVGRAALSPPPVNHRTITAA